MQWNIRKLNCIPVFTHGCLSLCMLSLCVTMALLWCLGLELVLHWFPEALWYIKEFLMMPNSTSKCWISQGKWDGLKQVPIQMHHSGVSLGSRRSFSFEEPRQTYPVCSYKPETKCRHLTLLSEICRPGLAVLLNYLQSGSSEVEDLHYVVLIAVFDRFLFVYKLP